MNTPADPNPSLACPEELLPEENIALCGVVDALCADTLPIDRTARPTQTHRHLLPSRDALIDTVEALRAVLFPTCFSNWDLSDEGLRFFVGATLDRVLHTLQEQIKRGLCLTRNCLRRDFHACETEAQTMTRRFLAAMPRLRRILSADVQAAYDGDPAAKSLEEIIFSYPGFRAITDYRLAHELLRLGVALIPRIITEHAHSQTGIDIHPGAQIGERFFIDHGTGVVIGETTIIGKQVRIYQGVTLGAKSFPHDEQGLPIKGIPRHPIVEDDVTIYSGATILGRVTIGRGSIIGGNVWLTRSVAPGSSISQSQVRHTSFEAGGGI